VDSILEGTAGRTSKTANLQLQQHARLQSENIAFHTTYSKSSSFSLCSSNFH
jgi:hypothetical protein